MSNKKLHDKFVNLHNIPFENQEFLNTLDFVSQFQLGQENSHLTTSSQLRLQLMKYELFNHNQLLNSLDTLKSMVDSSMKKLSEMKFHSLSLDKSITGTKEATIEVIEKTKQLKDSKEKLIKQQEVVTRFQSKYYLNDEEIEILTSNKISTIFFNILQRVPKILSDCKSLLREKQQPALLKIIDKLSLYQEQGYDRLYKWTINKCSNLIENVDQIVVVQISKESKSKSNLKRKTKHFKITLQNDSNENKNNNHQDNPDLNNNNNKDKDNKKMKPKFTKDKIRAKIEEIESDGILLKKALGTLKNRKVLLHNCIEELAKSRSEGILKGFITALTIGGENGTPAPIEIHSHDAVRFIGDMLAWTHQSLASEKELISWLLEDLLLRNGKTNNEKGNESQEIIKIENTLALIFETVSRPIKIRTEKSMESIIPLISQKRITNILEFYYTIISENIGKNAVLSKCLNSLVLKSSQIFMDSVKISGNNLLKQIPSQTKQLYAPQKLINELVQITKIVKIHSETLTTNLKYIKNSNTNKQREKKNENQLEKKKFNENSNEKENEKGEEKGKEKEKDNSNKGGIVIEEIQESQVSKDFKISLELMVQPLIKMCTLMVSDLNLSEMSVFMINSLCMIRKELGIYEFSKSVIEMIDGQIDAHLDTLVEEQAAVIFHRCEMGIKIKKIKQLDLANQVKFEEESLSLHQESTQISVPISQINGLEKMDIINTVKIFNKTILNNDNFVIPYVGDLIFPKFRMLVRKKIIQIIISGFKMIFQVVMESKNEYGNGFEIFTHTPNQMEEILNDKISLYNL
ncbi:component of oligomeric golgi complex 6 [Anaeramoeba flamelloides]|uniref:Conserved oligomeric Golgi complex subunit 6 n=1 Tax=Anaeramoeba flamelloides TaxID=1746091 RepID=A0ABQ8XD17_9EUKA|nr:component of oligomeric golgi complex 6 [Anaeramoeba flamelloides]